LAIVKFHGNFYGRTLPLSSTASLADLQNQVITTGVPFEEAAPRFEAAMHYMANQYRLHVDGNGAE
jgi:hypothetical protein